MSNLVGLDSPTGGVGVLELVDARELVGFMPLDGVHGVDVLGVHLDPVQVQPRDVHFKSILSIVSYYCIYILYYLLYLIILHILAIISLYISYYISHIYII